MFRQKLLAKVKRAIKKARHRAESMTGTDSHAEDPALVALRNKLIEECELPENLLCSILQDIPEQLVVTPYGNVFDRTSIVNWINTHHTCPLTRQPLKIHDLMENAKLAAMAAAVSQHLKTLIADITEMSASDEATIREKISVYNSLVALTDQDAADVLNFMRQQTLISALKNQLQLDINNHHHLAFWQAHANPKLDVCVNVRDTVFADVYRIPKIVHELMLVADEAYQTEAEFRAAIDAKRGQGRGVPTFFERPIAHVIARLFRPPTGAEICDAKDIKTLRLN